MDESTDFILKSKIPGPIPKAGTKIKYKNLTSVSQDRETNYNNN